MRALLIASAAAGVLLVAGCGRGTETANSTAPAADNGTGATETTAVASAGVTPGADVAEPATPEAAVQSAEAQDQSASSSTAAPYNFTQGAAVVRAVAAPTGLRLEENGRRYFYRPGETTPYLVREGSYSYAYSHGRLIGVLDDHGKRLDDRTMQARRGAAEQALARARSLRGAADHHAPPQARQAEQHDHGDGGRDNGPGDHSNGPGSQASQRPGDDHGANDRTQQDHGASDHGSASHDRSGHGSPSHTGRDRNGAARSGPDDNHDQVSDRERRRPGG